MYRLRAWVRHRQSFCACGDRLFDGQIGFGTHYIHQCKFDGDCDGDGDGDGMCKWTLIRPFIATTTFTNLLYRNDLFLVSHTVYISFDI